MKGQREGIRKDSKKAAEGQGKSVKKSENGDEGTRVARTRSAVSGEAIACDRNEKRSEVLRNAQAIAAAACRRAEKGTSPPSE